MIHANIVLMNSTTSSLDPVNTRLESPTALDTPPQSSLTASHLFEIALQHMENVASRLAAAGMSESMKEEYLWAERMLNLAMKVMNCEHRQRKLDFDIARSAARINSAPAESAATKPAAVQTSPASQSAQTSQPAPAQNPQQQPICGIEFPGESLLDQALQEARKTAGKPAKPFSSAPVPLNAKQFGALR